LIARHSRFLARRLRRALFCGFTAVLLINCADKGPPQLQQPVDTSGGRYSIAQHVGNLEHHEIREASGAALSNKSDKRIWVINDGGTSPTLLSFTTTGQFEQSFRLRQARNVDWEDLASFTWQGKDWLLIADIGDNLARRKYVSLYLVEEPASMADETAMVTREIRLTFPDGPRDCESLAVDTASGHIFLLSKRAIPAMLYSVPLSDVVSATPLVADVLGLVTSIPQPTEDDIRRALLEQNWHWQPTAMDISADNTTAAILTYRAVYVFARNAKESWFAAVQRDPVRLDISGIGEAESVVLSHNGESIFITTEGRDPPLIRFDYLQ
jgi:hypothetical protein